MTVQALKDELEAVRLTDTVDESFFEKLKGFDKVILRGAGGFGSEIGSQLLRHLPLNKMIYWDIRADEIKQLHGIEVVEPFSDVEQSDNTLIIHCIPNGSLSGSTILREMHQEGYSNIVDGMALFKSAFCKMRAETGYDAKNCLETTVCNWTNCERLVAFSERDCGNPKLEKKDDESLSFQVMDIFMSFKCTLGCKDCGAYMNVYADKELDQHVPYEQIIHDMDLFFDAIDTVAFVSVVGGEPFLHPQFPQVIENILKKKNFGVLGITTSGICKITDEALAVLKNDRTRVIFSDYTRALTDKQRVLFNENVKKVREFGIYYTVGEPVWATTPSLNYIESSHEQLVSMKQNCTSTKTCQALLNGRLYPCSTSLAVHELHAADYQSDYISLEDKDLRQAIKSLHNQPYYHSCKRCSDGGQQVEQSGIQARDSRFDHLLNGITVAVEV
jgi:organic radical activating enzyme